MERLGDLRGLTFEVTCPRRQDWLKHDVPTEAAHIAFHLCNSSVSKVTIQVVHCVVERLD
ncbi:hypothetical protein EBZ37_14640 [bacterium]|nr:hypothetical protein [bacterium]